MSGYLIWGHSGIVLFTMNDSRNGLDGYFLLRVKSRAFRSTLAGHSCSMSNEIHNTGCWHALRLLLLTCCKQGYWQSLRAGGWVARQSERPSCASQRAISRLTRNSLPLFLPSFFFFFPSFSFSFLFKYPAPPEENTSWTKLVICTGGSAQLLGDHVIP